MDILRYTFFQNALAGSLLIAIACGIVGTYIVSRRLVFISGGITHASFGGIGLGFYLGINPFVAALGFAVVAAFGVEWISKSHRVREDSAIAAVWSLGMAVGAICMVMTPGYAPNLSSYLFGNILTITRTDIILTAAFVVVLCLSFACFYREIIFTAFDREFAFTQRIPVKVVEYAMTVFIAITIVIAIRLVGIMLLMSLLTVPQMTVNMFTSDYRRIVGGSIALGFVACLAGLFLSYWMKIPTGAFIIIVLLLCFIAAKGMLWLVKRTVKKI